MKKNKKEKKEKYYLKTFFFPAGPSKSAIIKQMESSAAQNKSENKMKKVESGEGYHSVKITALMVK